MLPHSRFVEQTVGRRGGHHLSEHWDQDQDQDRQELQQSREGVLWDGEEPGQNGGAGLAVWSNQ